jgi:GTP-binding protein Era
MQELPGQKIKTGMVAIVGPPNVGKSTLLNTLLGQKISIVSPKPQTTRNRIIGIVNDPAYQIVLLDTPGLHRAGSPLNLEMVRIATESLAGVDVICFLLDVSLPLPEKDAEAVDYLKDTACPAILVLNKIDLKNRQALLPMIDAYRKLYPFAAIIPISALYNSGTDILLREILAHLPEGPRLYPEDIPTESTERFIVAEMIREKIFLHTGQEVPYAAAVVVESFQEDEARGLVTIHATIYVEKDSQKGIVIGSKGSRLTKIGSSARHDIEELLGQKVLLKLWVKVKKHWTRDLRFIRELEG